MRRSNPKTKITKLPKLARKRKTASHHVRLPDKLETWAEAKATTYRSVAAWIVDLVRDAYEAEQQNALPRAA